MAGRPLTEAERILAREVFADAVQLEPVRLHVGGFGRFAVTVGARIFLPQPLGQADFGRADLNAQALFVHELTHVWQFQTRPLWTLRSWAATVLQGGYGPGLPGYRYALPLPSFEQLSLERQASVVEHAFLLRRGQRITSMPGLRSSDLYGATPFPITA